MDHPEAIQLGAVEKYLLNELPPEQRSEFEDHYFDCQECALDLRATAAFMEAAKQEFQQNPVPRPAAAQASSQINAKPRLLFFRRPAILTAALAASLLVLVYQNVVVYPRTHAELAQLESPAIVPTLSLIRTNSRGGAEASATVAPLQPLLLSFDIPPQPAFASYTCRIYTPGGALAGSVQVSSQMAKDTVTISAPVAQRVPGAYTLVVSGNSDSGQGSPVVTYHFNLTIQ
jgi:hypothetical protein